MSYEEKKPAQSCICKIPLLLPDGLKKLSYHSNYVLASADLHFIFTVVQNVWAVGHEAVGNPVTVEDVLNTSDYLPVDAKDFCKKIHYDNFPQSSQ